MITINESPVVDTVKISDEARLINYIESLKLILIDALIAVTEVSHELKKDLEGNLK